MSYDRSLSSFVDNYLLFDGKTLDANNSEYFVISDLSLRLLSKLAKQEINKELREHNIKSVLGIMKRFVFKSISHILKK